MPLACALIVNPDRDFEPCAAKLARMQAHSHARCPHADPSQRAKWDAAELSILGKPVHASRTGPPILGRRNQRGSQLAGATLIFARRARKVVGPLVVVPTGPGAIEESRYLKPTRTT